MAKRRKSGDGVAQVTVDIDKKAFEGMEKAISSFNTKLSEAVRVSGKETEKFRNAYRGIQDQFRQATIDHAKAATTAEKEVHILRIRHLKREAAEQQRALKQLNDERQEAIKSFKSSLDEKITGAADSLETALSKIQARDLSIAKSIGDALVRRGRALKGTDPKGGAQSKLGGGLIGMGIGLAKIGLIGAAVMALGKTFISAADKVKEMNKGIVESGANVAALASAGQNVEEAFKSVRKAFFLGKGSFSFNSMWGSTPEENYKVMGAFAQAGFDINEMVQGLEKGEQTMRRMQDVAQQAHIYGQIIFGSAEESARTQAEMMDEYGLSIEAVGDKLAVLYDKAVASGFGTKQFYSTILQATSGMSMYNMRLDETAGLLSKLGRGSGTKDATDMVTGAVNRFTKSSIQDRLQQGMLLGDATMRRLMEGSQTNALKAFLSSTAGKMGGLQLKLSEMGVKGDMTSAEGLRKALGGLTSKQSSDLVGEMLYLFEGDDSLTKQLQPLLKLLQTKTSEQRLLNMDMLGPGQSFGVPFAMSRQHFGKSIHEVMASGMTDQVNALTQLTGLSLEDLNKLAAKSVQLAGEYSVLLKKAQQGTTAEEQAALAGRLGATVAGGKIFSATVDAQGKVIFGKQLATEADYIEDIGTFRGEEEARDEALVLAQNMVDNTQTLSDKLELGTNWILGEISETLGDFFSAFMDSLSPGEDKAAALGRLDAAETVLKAEERKLASDIPAAQKAMAGLSGPELAAKQVQVAEMQAQLIAVKKELSGVRSWQRAYQRAVATNSDVKSENLPKLRMFDQSPSFSSAETAALNLLAATQTIAGAVPTAEMALQGVGGPTIFERLEGLKKEAIAGVPSPSGTSGTAGGNNVLLNFLKSKKVTSPESNVSGLRTLIQRGEANEWVEELKTNYGPQLRGSDPELWEMLMNAPSPNKAPNAGTTGAVVNQGGKIVNIDVNTSANDLARVVNQMLTGQWS